MSQNDFVFPLCLLQEDFVLSVLLAKTMKPKARIFLIAFLVVAWVLPSVRLAQFCSDAWRVYQEEQSLNAWNDVTSGIWLAGAYAVCLVVPTLFLLLPRMNGNLGFVLVAACLLIAVDVIRRHPEEVIVLFPSMSPLRPVCWTALALFVVGLLYFLQGRGSQQTASPNGGPTTQFCNSEATEGPPSVS